MYGMQRPGWGVEFDESMIRKALDSSSASGTNLIPQMIDPMIPELALAMTPLQGMVPRIPWTSGTYDKRLRSQFGRGRFVGDGKSAPETNSTYTKFTETMKIMQAKGSVTGYLQKVTQNLLDTVRNEVKGNMIGLTQERENALVYGNASADALAFKGLEQWTQTGYSNLIHADGATVSTDLFDQALSAITRKGITLSPANAFWLLDTQMIDKVSSLKQSGQRWNSEGGKINVPGGFRFETYRDLPLIPTSMLTPNQAWIGSTVNVAASDTGGSLTVGAYKYYVSAVLITGETKPSAEVTGTIGAVTTGKITLTWTAPVAADSVRYYKIYRTAAAGGTGTQVLYTVIPGYVATYDALGFMTSTDVYEYVDNGVRDTQSASGHTITGANYIPGSADAKMDELATDESDIYLVVTSAPSQVEGYTFALPTVQELTYKPLAPIFDREWWLVYEYFCSMCVEQYQVRITRAKHS